MSGLELFFLIWGVSNLISFFLIGKSMTRDTRSADETASGAFYAMIASLTLGPLFTALAIGAVVLGDE